MSEPESQQSNAPSPTKGGGQIPDADSQPGTTPVAATPPLSERSNRNATLLMLVGGAAGGLLGWGLITLFGTQFQVSPEAAAAQEVAMASASPTHDPQYVAEKKIVDFRNTILRWMLAGTAIASAITFMAAYLAPRRKHMEVLLVAGPVSGAVFGAVGAWVAQMLALYLAGPVSVPAEVASILPHLMAWGLVGAGSGLGVGLIRRSGVRTLSFLLFGAISGIVAVLAYQFVVMIGFPLENTTPLVPETRWFGVFWGILGGALIALGLGRALQSVPTREGR